MKHLASLGCFHIGMRFDDGIITDILKGFGLSVVLVVSNRAGEKRIKIQRVSRHKWVRVQK